MTRQAQQEAASDNDTFEVTRSIATVQSHSDSPAGRAFFFQLTQQALFLADLALQSINATGDQHQGPDDGDGGDHAPTAGDVWDPSTRAPHPHDSRHEVATCPGQAE